MKITQALIQTLAILGAATSTNAALRGAEENASQPAQPYLAVRKGVRESVNAAKRNGEEPGDMVAYAAGGGYGDEYEAIDGDEDDFEAGGEGYQSLDTIVIRGSDLTGTLPSWFRHPINPAGVGRKNGAGNIQSLERIGFYYNFLTGVRPSEIARKVPKQARKGDGQYHYVADLHDTYRF